MIEKTEGLSKRQSDVLHFLKKTIRNCGIPPTLKEICSEFGFASTNGVSQILAALEKKGYIKRISKGASRAIQLNKYGNEIENEYLSSSYIKNLTIIGDGSADNPLSVFMTNKGQISVDTRYFGNYENMFAALVEDNGMSIDGIIQGDIAIAAKMKSIESGNIVLALVNDMVFARIIRQQQGSFELNAASKGFPRMKFLQNEPNVSILGIVLGIIRKQKK